jgi:hypothetical protein
MLHLLEKAMEHLTYNTLAVNPDLKGPQDG